MSRRLLAPGAALLALLVWPRLLCAGSNVEDQRHRLPEPAVCPDDPVAGDWLAHTYEPKLKRWERTKLEIYRATAGSTALRGRIINETWFGPESRVQPGECDSHAHYTVQMDANGDTAGESVHFDAYGEWKMQMDHCGNFGGAYYLDHFSGVIDPSIQEFQSENNDGGTAFHLPVVFRRIRCHTDPVWREPVAPPPFAPPQGCGCG